jgi:hypothetical protein
MGGLMSITMHIGLLIAKPVAEHFFRIAIDYAISDAD